MKIVKDNIEPLIMGKNVLIAIVNILIYSKEMSLILRRLVFMKIVDLKQNIFKENEVTADKIRDEFKTRKIND